MLAGDHAEFVRFVLSGKDRDGIPVVIDPLADSDADLQYFSTSRDYDSLLGIDVDIVTECSITAFPVARREDTLTKDIHVTGSFKNSTASSNDISISCVTYIWLLG